MLKLLSKGKRGIFVSLVVCCIMLMTTFVQAASFTQVASNATYGCKRNFGEGIYDATTNKTWICWNGPNMDVYVKEYNHATSAWGADVKVATVNQSGTYAYHDYPVMIMGPDNKLKIYYSIHTTNMHQVSAPNVRSITGTWTNTIISADSNTYPMPVAAGGSIYAFYSKNDDPGYPYRSYKFIKSTDNGATWSAPVTVINSQKLDPSKFDEVYAFGVNYDSARNRIQITFTMSGGIGHNVQARDCYYTYLNTTNDNMYNATGTSLGTCVLYSELASCRVFEATPTESGTYGQMHPVTNIIPDFDGNGVQVVAFDYTNASDLRVMKFAKWNGSSWTITTGMDPIISLHDMIKTGTTTFKVACRDVLKNLVIRTTTNDGATWTTERTTQIPYLNGADSISYANFLASPVGSPERMLISEINLATKTTDYTGAWPVYIYQNDNTATPTPTPTGTFDNFEDGNANGWTVTAGTWSVVSDGTYVYKQTNNTVDAIAYYNATAWTDVIVQGNVKMYDNTAGNSGSSIVARFVDIDNYYCLKIETEGLGIYKRSGGVTTMLGTYATTLATGTTYTLKLNVNGSTLTGYLNGTQRISVTDSSISSGKIGVKVYNQVASFDNISAD